jgi:hypothetical protein
MQETIGQPERFAQELNNYSTISDTVTSSKSIHHDSFVRGLKERLPAETRDTFTAEQLESLKLAFGTRGWSQHPVDVRFTFKFFRSRYYFVLVAGRKKCDEQKKASELSLFAKAFVKGSLMLLWFAIASILMTFCLYILKSALNVDFFPDFSFGIWDWFQTLF